jgi:DNA-binding winged helix-turn-helix (wHTH) protein
MEAVQVRCALRFAIDDLVLDVGQCRLSRGPQEIRLTKLNFLLLRCLVEAAPNVRTHDELATAVWGARRIVTPDNLAKRIMLLRHALGDTAAHPRYIEAVRGFGYRMAATVQPLEDRGLAALPARGAAIAAASMLAPAAGAAAVRTDLADARRDLFRAARSPRVPTRRSARHDVTIAALTAVLLVAALAGITRLR